MKNVKSILGLMCAVAVLSGCDGARKALTQTKAAPDEFEVYARAPLTVPPDYGLRPPAEGEVRREDNTSVVARRVMLGRDGQSAQSIQANTPGTTALLAMAGADRAEPGIREDVNRETMAYAQEDQTFMEYLMFDPDPGKAVNPQEERQRIQENQALGKPLIDGETQSIERKEKAPLEGLFDGWFN